ncbi:FAD-binding protein [Formosa sp. Hel1_33_131]|uniref:FAD-binding and (Fe-S)-binding domain-containing protein n=1 Tax=Formosa sp. Hel1_33_131 TaxID=1336794 RepID=UPI00084E33AA|nr:FAD-binding and (Fe-S)-binding domain-containing protein [Formosa sp. Hel1_33_131]AOR27123.1 FAD-binding protein [Formosa sp. Hel1_33_131]
MQTHLTSLKQQLSGELYDSDLVKTLYATDASVYRELPYAVAIPKTTEDIKRLIEFASANALSIIPRAAGTSLAGQCVGDGIVVDVSKYMNEILEINTQEQWVRVQPGVVRDHLNTFLKPYGFFFGPNTSTANRCTMGGMVGNNSCGSTSIVYGATRDHTLAVKAILSDGSDVEFSALSKEEFISKTKGTSLEAALYKHIFAELDNHIIREQIETGYPKASITRRNTGYAVDALMQTNVFEESKEDFNFSKLLCGSEGTLAFTTELKLQIVPLPKPFQVVLNAHFNSITESLQATLIAMKQAPSACELMDKTILDCTKDNITQQKNRFFVEGDPEAILMVEFRGDTLEDAKQQAFQLETNLKASNLGYAYKLVEGDDCNKVWDLRKAGLGLLANIPGDAKAVACIEDTAVALDDLPLYIEAFTTLMKSYHQKAVYYAHAGAGELHLRPILNLKSSTDVALFRSISEASAKLVKSFKGALSGEHGDGRVRSEFIPLVLGEENYQLLKRIKSTWDPLALFNPGKIVNAVPMDAALRYEADKTLPKVETLYNFESTGGILNTVEKCNGSGDCRKLSFAGGTMCPSYRATLDEKDSTRGRANVLREFLTQNTKENPFDHPEIKEALDLCVSCKACKSECPSNVDMASLKAEFLYQYQKTNPVSLRSKLIAHNAKINAVARRFAGIYNFIGKSSWFKSLIGVHPKRSLPNLQSKTLRQWFDSVQQGNHPRSVYLFCDEYTNHYDVEIGKKTILLLNKLGYKVHMPKHPESARAYISKGFLDQAKSIATENINTFSNLVSKDRPLVGIEPSAILGFRDEYPNLVDVELKSNAENLAQNVFMIEEFLANEMTENKIDVSKFTTKTETIHYHGHCHQKALSSNTYAETILAIPPNFKVETIDAGCCGMAGSFGYEKEHYELSQQIGEDRLFPSLRGLDTDVLLSASGTSCRHQIRDGVNKTALHPIEVLYDALNEPL